MKNFFRRLLGIRTKRRALPITPVPPTGTTIIRNGFKIKVTQTCSPELWDWLLLSGWRVVPVRHDRRAGTTLPDAAMHMLNAASVEQREHVMGNLLSSANRSRKVSPARAPARR